MATANAIILMGNSYSEYLKGNLTDSKFCGNLSLALSALQFQSGRKTFKVEITKNTNPNDFFGMRIFPEFNLGEDFLHSMVYEEVAKYGDIIKRWKTIDKWVLELDSNLFVRDLMNFTPDELVAMTLHEIGHVLESEKPVERFYRSYKEVKLRLDATNRATEKMIYSIYMIPLSIACSQRSWVNGKNEINKEMMADQTALEYGFARDLVSAFNKIIKRYGSINSQESQLQKEVDTSMQWCYQNIDDVMKRKEHLKDELYYQAIKSKSNYMKAVVITVLDKVGIKLRERYNGYVIESTVEILNDPDWLKKYEPMIDLKANARFEKSLESMISSEESAMEGFFNKRKKIKVVLPSQYEVDAISVEIDNIRSHADRIFVLDLIYDLKEKINNFEEVISVDPALVRKWQGQINRMNDELEMYRKATLEKKVLEKNYKFLVQLPPEAADYVG